MSYLRAVVINGCRSVHRRRKVARRYEEEGPDEAGQVSAEQEVIEGDWDECADIIKKAKPAK